MREIIFKGKDWLGNWHIGSIIRKLCENNSKTSYYANSGMCNHIIKVGDYYIIDENGEGFWVLPETISQYTSLNDKNGKKIFEGDLSYYDWSGNQVLMSVIFKNGEFGLYPVLKYDFKVWGIRINGQNKKLEIIGNIHDNPELLEGGEGGDG